MLTQHYKLPIQDHHHGKAKPGQVILNESDEFVIGFVDFVSDTHFVVMLFQPMDLEWPEMINIAETCDPGVRLVEIIDENPEIAEMWHKLYTIWENEDEMDTTEQPLQ